MSAPNLLEEVAARTAAGDDDTERWLAELPAELAQARSEAETALTELEREENSRVSTAEQLRQEEIAQEPDPAELARWKAILEESGPNAIDETGEVRPVRNLPDPEGDSVPAEPAPEPSPAVRPVEAAPGEPEPSPASRPVEPESPTASVLGAGVFALGGGLALGGLAAVVGNRPAAVPPPPPPAPDPTPPTAAPALWFYTDGGTTQGPLEREELLTRLPRTPLGWETPVWTEGMQEWTSARTAGLATAAAAPPAPPLPMPIPIPKARRFCHSCGNAVELGDRFCAACGTALRPPTP